MPAIILIAIGCLFSACSKKTECCVVVDMNLDLDVRYKNDHSVFDPSQTGHLNADSIQVYYLIDGKYQLQKNSSSGKLQGFTVLTEGKPERTWLNIFINDHIDKQDMSYTLVKYGSLQTDTIKALVKKLVIQKLWLNDVEISRKGEPYLRKLK